MTLTPNQKGIETQQTAFRAFVYGVGAKPEPKPIVLVPKVSGRQAPTFFSMLEAA